MTKKKLTWDNISTFVYPISFGVLIVVLWQTELLHKLLGADTFTLPLPSRILAIIGITSPP